MLTSRSAREENAGFKAIEEHFDTCEPGLLSLARLLYAARQKMKGPLGLVAEGQPVWLDVERISRMSQGSILDRLDTVEQLVSELVRLHVITVVRRDFVGAEEVRPSFGFVFRPVADWRSPDRFPHRQPAPGDRFRSPSLPNCGRVVVAVGIAPSNRVGQSIPFVSYSQVGKDGTIKPDVITIDRASWDTYVDRMVFVIESKSRDETDRSSNG